MPEIQKTSRIYHFPAQEPEFSARWWSVPQAAAVWGITYDTARRRILMDPDRVGAVMVPVQTKRGRCPIYRLCVPIGTPLPELPTKGNPHFLDPDWQRANVARRWGDRPNIQQPPQYHGNDRSINLAERENS